MTASHEPFAELAAAHALGALEGDDLARFEAHLREGCRECEAAMREHEAALVEMSVELATPPPPAVKHALLAKLGPAPRTARVVPFFRAAAGMALAAGIAAAAVGLGLRARYEARLAGVEQLATGLRQDLARQQELLALLQDPATRVVRLGGLAPSPQALGRVVWNERAGGVFLASDLPAAPAGKAYELWAIAGGTPRPAGVFSVDAKGRGRLEVAPLPGGIAVDQFAVTLEPAAGVPSPTGAMYLASS
jgi:anti-sigma-K factor RskA